MELRTYSRALRRGWWLVLVFVLLGVLGGFVVNQRATPTYLSKLTFFVGTPKGNTATSALTEDQFAQRRVNSYVELLSSQRLASLVVADAGLDISAGKVASEITGSAQLNTVLLQVRVVDPSKSRSLAIANSVAKQFGSFVSGLEGRDTTASSVTLTVTSDPTLIHKPISPRKSFNLGVGLAIGLVLGLIAAAIKELMDNTIGSNEGLAEVSDSPVLATMMLSSAAKRSPVLVDSESHSVRAEAFRQLRTNLQFVDVDHPAQVVVVTSAVSGEGKSTTAANLAVVFSESGRRVLLVEADMRRPAISDYMGLERAVGLSNVLAGQVDAHDVFQQWGSGVTVLTCGSVPPNPSELLASKNMGNLISTLRQEFDLIVFDTPPLLPVTDAAVLATQADGVVIVVRTNRTTRSQLASAVRSLTNLDSRLLGFVTIAKLPRSGNKRREYASYYSSSDSTPTPQASGRTAEDHEVITR